MEASPPITLHEVTAGDAGRLGQVRALFEEYAAALPFDLCFQGFREELAALPGAYGPPRGVLLLAQIVDEAAGCVALRPSSAPESCEMKRLYVRPAFRQRRLGRVLCESLLERAAGLGYRRMRLDTVPSLMPEAFRLYGALGFAPTAPYTRNLHPEVMFLERAL